MRSKELPLTPGGTEIKAWLYFPEPQPKRLIPAIVLCHGIPGSARPDPQDRGYLPLVETFTGEGFACVIFNFRGCGLSGGNIDMSGWCTDLEAVIEAVSGTPGIDPDALHCIGFSAGGAIASKVASREKTIASLLLMATPHNFADILPPDPKLLREHFVGLGTIRDKDYPGDLTGWYQGFLDVLPARYLPFVSPRPVQIVHGDQDNTVPPEHARLLFETACQPKKLVILEGAGHQLRKDHRTQQIIRSWLKEVA